MVRLYSIIFLSLLLLLGCKEDLEFPGEKDFPFVVLKNPLDNNFDGVTLSGSLIINSQQTHNMVSYGFVIDEKYVGIDTLIIGQAEYSIDYTYRLENFSNDDRSIKVQAFGRDEHNTYLSNRITIGLEGTSHEIHDFNPKVGNKGDTLVIKGYRFSSEKNPEVKINKSIAPILSISSDSIVIKVPTSMGSEAGRLSVKLDNHEVMTTDTFKYLKPKILDVSTYVAWENDTIIIIGENFNLDTEVIIGDAETRILQLSRDKLIVHLEKATFRVIEELVVSSDGLRTYTTEPFRLLSSWRQIRNFPIKTSHGMGFTINKKGHVGRNSFYEYNPTTNLWIQKSDIPAGSSYLVGFVFDNRGFIIRTHTSWPSGRLYEFLPDENQWVQKTSFPGNSTRISTLDANNRVFAYGGNTDDDNAPNFFEYKPQSDSWHPSAHLSVPVISQTIAFSIDNDGYMGTGIDHLSGSLTNTIYRYNLLNDSWTEVSEFPVSIAEGIGFSIDGVGYAGLGRSEQGENREIYTYDPMLDQWKWVTTYPDIHTRGCVTFTIEGKVYIGTGRYYPLQVARYTNAFYEFDPQYLRENYQHPNP
ncbi:MAG: hypothetical protein EA361_02800 [Bacteroidetes bacterium]|nr:MAG: hypothetical protein EA361_02800 [Bacteroidota bacterium]